MSLSDLVIKRRQKSRPSPEQLVATVLKNFGVSAPKAVAETVVDALKEAKYLEDKT